MLYSNNGLNGVMSNIWDALSSGYAIAIYAIVLFVIVALLVVMLMVGDKRTPNVILADDISVDSAIAVSGEAKANAEKKESVEKTVEGEEGEEEERKRFYMLSKLDEERPKFKREKYDENV
ncbi:MAG: hypothetical protein IJ506_00535, partial [Clostridia bacterium]|nr:hypothetical protein [Clostridia bacterium]